MQKGYVLVGLKNNNTLHNTENPIHLKLAAQLDLKEKFKSKIICWGPKLNNKKNEQFNHSRGRSSGTSVGEKHTTHGY